MYFFDSLVVLLSYAEMVKIQKNIDVGSMTTFGLPCVASNYAEITVLDDLVEICGMSVFKNNQKWILSGGSNTVFCGDYAGIVLKVRLKGIEIVSESETQVEVKVAAGEDWHEFVRWAVENDFGGIENLSLIPGNVGTCPIQNIGAYGVEVKDVISRLKFWDFEKCELIEMRNEDCKFGYRDSIFKNALKGKGLITDVTFRLSKPGFHKLNLSYGAIKSELENSFGNLNEDDLSLDMVSQVVMKIRSAKLPNWKELGTAGSFFKNPFVSLDIAKELKAKFDDMPMYPAGSFVKLAAGWLIDQCGLKGKEFGSIRVYEKQALVLVNTMGDSGNYEDLVSAVAYIQNAVMDKFDVELEPEVNMVSYEK